MILSAGLAPKLSIVVPCYNDEPVLREYYAQTKPVLDALGETWELVFVNDGSRDGTWKVIRELCRDPQVQGVDLSRNFGHMAALTAGLDHASGEAVITMDSDLQDPPDVIPHLLEKWKEGYDVVYAVRAERKEGFFKRLTADLFYRLMRRMSLAELPQEAGEFRLMTRRVVDALRLVEERHRFMRGLTAWAGFKQTLVPYTRAESKRRDSGYTLARMCSLAFDAITSFSVVPLRIAFVFGLILSMLAFLAAGFYVAVRVINPDLFRLSEYRGFTMLFVTVSLFAGIQLLMLGVLGEYVGRVYDEVKRRPLYLVQERLGKGA